MHQKFPDKFSLIFMGMLCSAVQWLSREVIACGQLSLGLLANVANTPVHALSMQQLWRQCSNADLNISSGFLSGECSKPLKHVDSLNIIGSFWVS